MWLSRRWTTTLWQTTSSLKMRTHWTVKKKTPGQLFSLRLFQSLGGQCIYFVNCIVIWQQKKNIQNHKYEYRASSSRGSINVCWVGALYLSKGAQYLVLVCVHRRSNAKNGGEKKKKKNPTGWINRWGRIMEACSDSCAPVPRVPDSLKDWVSGWLAG